MCWISISYPMTSCHSSLARYLTSMRPSSLHADQVGVGALRIRLEVECDEWRLRRLRMHWEKIVGVQSVVTTQLDSIEDPAAGGHLAPTAR